MSSVEREVKAMVEDAVTAEVDASSMERSANLAANGYIRSHSFALSTCDTTWALPDCLPLGSVLWPEPLLALWKTVKYSSLVGVFPSIGRVWYTVDNKLVLWDYRTGLEFYLYDEIPELIIAVGAPVKPCPDVFQAHVAYVFPVATPTMIFLLGLCVLNVAELTEIKIVNLGYAVSTDVVITRMLGMPNTGRIFCAGANGNVYELRYTRTSSPLVPKIRMVCFSYLFASRVLLGQISSFVETMKQTWSGPKPGLLDIVIDGRRELLFSLDEKSTICIWRIVRDGLQFLKSYKHQPSAHVDRGGFHRDHEEGSPLLRLFIVEPDHEGCSLIAIAGNGDHFGYRYYDTSSILGDRRSEISLRSYTPSCFPANREVSACFAAESTVILAHCDKADDTAVDEVAMISTPKAIMDPHGGYRGIVTDFSARSSNITRVDAIDKLANPAHRSSNELCAQVCYPPTRYIVVHRHGVSVFMQLRPVDMLFAIMHCATAQCRDSLLQRFSAVYSAVDYSAMLLQLALGALHVRELQSLKWSSSSRTAQMPPSYSGMDGGAPSLEELGRQLADGDSQEVRRMARNLLRGASVPTTQSDLGHVSGGRQVTVFMSPFASGVVAYMARALSSVWEVPIVNLLSESLGPVEVVMSKLIAFLEGMDVGVQSGEALRVDLPHQWQRNRVIVRLPTGTNLSISDVSKLQMSMLSACLNLARKALQTALVLRQSRYIPMKREEIKTTFAHVVCDSDTAHKLAQYISDVILSSQQGLSSTTSERLASFDQLQKLCPYFFSTVDTRGYRAYSDIDDITRGEGVGSYSEQSMAQWLASVLPNASAYWKSGRLLSICQQLRDVKKESVAVQLLLHAASQLDPEKTAFAVYLTEYSGQSAQSGVNPVTYEVYQSKRRALEQVVAILEAAWHSHRSAVDSMLGGPRSSGTIWQMEPTDEMAHCFLFDWLCAAREDPGITHTLRDTLVACRSPFLDAYLSRNAMVLGEVYAHYLRRTQGNYKGAIEQSLLLAQSALPGVPSADRLSYRLRCLREALDCARECHSDQEQQVEQRLKLMEAQQRLCGIVTDYLNSREPQLDRQWGYEGRRATEREIATEHAELLANYVCTATDLLQMAGMYAAFGGAEVQLDVLKHSNVSDPVMYASCIVRAYEHRSRTVEEVTRALTSKYYPTCISFPLSCLVRVLEAREYQKAPQGSLTTVTLLINCGVDVKVIFHAYQDVMEARDGLEGACEHFIKVGVSTGYLIHSLAATLLHMSLAAWRGTLQPMLVTNAMSVVQNYLQMASQCEDANERTALDAASSLLTQSDNVIHKRVM